MTVWKEKEVEEGKEMSYSMEEKVPYVPILAWVVNKKEPEEALPAEKEKTQTENQPVKAGYMRLIDGIRMRTVAGQTLLYPTGEAVKKVYQPAMLNREATVLVNMMKEDFTVDSIVEQGLRVFRVQEDVLRKDVEKLVDSLTLAGMLEGEEVDEKLKKATTSLSGTAVVENGKVVSGMIGSKKRTFSPVRTVEKNKHKQ